METVNIAKYKLILEYAFVVCTFLILIHMSLPTTKISVTNWDEGNVHYSHFAWSQGKTPNIDFRYGYPGLMAWVQMQTVELVGNNYRTVKFLALFAGLIASGAMFLLIKSSLGTIAGLSLSLFVFGISYNSWPLANPGFWAQACTILGLLLVYQSLNGSYRETLNDVLFYGGIASIGLAFGFKQSGLFGILGMLQCLTVVISAYIVRIWIRISIYVLAVLTPFVLFLVFRVLPHGFDLPFNSIAVLPWGIACGLCWKFVYNPLSITKGLSLKRVAFGYLVLIIASVSWLGLYSDPLLTLPKLINELFFILPALIDRYQVKATIPQDVASYGFFIFLGTVFVVYKIVELNAGFFKNKRTKLAFGLFLIVISGILILQEDITSFILLLAPQNWDKYIFPSVVAILTGLAFWTRKKAFSLGTLFIVLMGFVILAGCYPYPSNFRYSSFGIAVGYISPFLLFQNSFRLVYIKTIVPFMFMIYIISFIGINRMVEITWEKAYYQRTYPNLNLKIGVSEKYFVFFDIAEWLKQNLSPLSTIGGYPNFGLVFVLIEKTSFDQYPNFIGSRHEFNDLVRLIEVGKGPDYYLISPTNYPYSGSHPYFFPSASLIQALEKHYQLVKVFSVGNEEIRLYHLN